MCLFWLITTIASADLPNADAGDGGGAMADGYGAGAQARRTGAFRSAMVKGWAAAGKRRNLTPPR